jgi:UDP-2,3-diacylglucosamine hydrolase
MTGGLGLRLLANVYECVAEPEWHKVEFISDLHLSDATPATFEVWAHYLRTTQADAVFILGDLFEVWIGDDARTPGSFAQRAADVLQEAASLRPMSFMAGNRDFLVGAAMLRDCGVAALPDPTVLDAWGQRILLSHGDELCLSDTEYQRFRRQVRSDAWRLAFLAKPLAERERLARDMRAASEAAKLAKFGGHPASAWADVDTAAAVSWMHAAGSRTLIHGHTHRPGNEVLAPGHTRHVLSDWDVDSAPRRAEALRLTRDGIARIDLLAA